MLDFPRVPGYDKGMETRFPHPVRRTRVRSFASRAALREALVRANGLAVVDLGCGFEAAGYPVAGGEGSKRWDELEWILSWLASERAERSRPLVAIGGGATLDLAALAASLYRRGMPLVLAPTTLLGMVDATLGGKTAVDLELDGRLLKNFAGTFFPAREVWLCLDFLRTLPPRERVSGAGEVYKTMWIRGGKWNEAALAAYLRDGSVRPALGGIVRDCLAVKAKFVEKDPLDEKRIRELLNFGHTVGHALESAARGRLSHGECVLWGMAVETSLLGPRGRSMAECCAFVLRALAMPAPPEFAAVGEEEWLRLLGADKKAKGGRIELSLLAAPGRVVKKSLSPAVIARSIGKFRL